MAQSFGFVEEKLYEAEFFLEKLRNSSRLSFEGQCYFSAFVSAARSVTLALQASMDGVPGFDVWYQAAREHLKSDPLAPFFVEIRNNVVHRGLNPLNRTGIEHLRDDLYGQMTGRHTHTLILPDVRSKDETVLADAVDVSTQYFRSLVSIIFECYERFTCIVDPRWYCTRENFEAMGKDLGDALFEIGLPRDWLAAAPKEDQAWRILRSQQPRNQLNDLFLRYLGRQIPSPDEKVEPNS